MEGVPGGRGGRPSVSGSIQGPSSALNVFWELAQRMLTAVLGASPVITPWCKGGKRVRELVTGSGTRVKDKQ